MIEILNHRILIIAILTCLSFFLASLSTNHIFAINMTTFAAPTLDKGLRALTTFSLNESNLNEALNSLEQKAKVTINGTNVTVNSLTSKPTAQIQLEGFAQVRSTPSGEFVIVMPNVPSNKTIDSIVVNLTAEEKLTIEGDAISIINRCSEKRDKSDSEELAKCDVYIKHLSDKCDQFANTLSYCDESKFSSYFFPRYVPSDLID